MIQAGWQAIYTGAGLFWKSLLALALGYAISAGIQVFLSRREAAKHLGGGKAWAGGACHPDSTLPQQCADLPRSRNAQGHRPSSLSPIHG